MKIGFKRVSKALALALATYTISFSTFADTAKFKLVTDVGSKGSPSALAVEKWASLVSEQTKGTDNEIKVDVFYENELGDQKEVLDLLVAGEIDMMLNFPMSSYDKRMGIRNIPYLFTTWEQAFDAYKPGGYMNTAYKEIHRDLGLKYFGAWPEGFGGVATKGRYATTLAGASGIKVRVPSNFPNPQTLRAMGYQPTAITWGEVYTSIQTGVVDGEAGNVIYWDYEYFRDVLDYYVHTKHVFTTGALCMNLKSWEGLNEKQKEIVSDAAMVVMNDQFANAREHDRYYVDKAVKSGMKYIVPSIEELKALAKVVRERVWPVVGTEIGAELFEKIRKKAPNL